MVALSHLSLIHVDTLSNHIISLINSCLNSLLLNLSLTISLSQASLPPSLSLLSFLLPLPPLLSLFPSPFLSVLFFVFLAGHSEVWARTRAPLPGHEGPNRRLARSDLHVRPRPYPNLNLRMPTQKKKGERCVPGREREREEGCFEGGKKNKKLTVQ